jgi:hypothetical protein
MANPQSPMQFEIIAKGKGSAVVRLAGRRAPVLLLHRDVVTQFQNAAEAIALRMRSNRTNADGVQALIMSFNSMVDQFVVESERFAESLFDLQQNDPDAGSKEFETEMAALKELREDGDLSNRPVLENPYFDITLNGSTLARADTGHGHVIHALVHLISSGASLTAGEVRAADAPHGILNCELSPGDRLAIRFGCDGASLKQNNTVTRATFKYPTDDQRLPMLKVSTSKKPEVCAHLGAYETLQAVMDFREGKCTLKVGSMSIDENGDSTGTHWLTYEVEVGECIQIEYVA